MTTIIGGSSPSITFSDSTTQTTAFSSPVSVSNGGTGLTSVGTNGQVLASNGTSLSYITPSAGSVTLISTQIVSSASTIQWTGLSASSGYGQWLLICENMKMSNYADILLQYGTGSTPTWVTSNYNWDGLQITGSTLSGKTGSSDSGIQLDLGTFGFGYGYSGGGQVFIQGSTVVFTANSNMSVTDGSGSTNKAYQAYGTNNNGGTVTALRLAQTASETFSGKFSLYGITS